MCAVKEEATTLHLLWMQSMPCSTLQNWVFSNISPKVLAFSVLFITILCVLDVFTLH